MAKLTSMICGLLALLALASFGQAFDSKEFFTGDWDLEIQRNYLYTGAFGAIDEMKWRIKDANETLEGIYVDEKDEERTIRIEFDGPHKGRFFVSNEEETETEVVAEEFEVFAFDLGNRSTGCFVSQGNWRDDVRAERGLYELVVTSPMTFVMTLWLRNATNVFDQVHTITAKKYVEKAAPSFLQRFGMPLAVVGFIIVSQFLKARGQPAAPAPQGQRRPRPAGSAEGSEQGPRFEEIKEGENEGEEGEEEGEDDVDAGADGEGKKDK